MMDTITIKPERKFSITLPCVSFTKGIIWFKGSNGIGKTTLLRALSSKFKVDALELLDSKKKDFIKQSSLFFESTMLSHNESLLKNLNYLNSFVEMNEDFQKELFIKLSLTESILKRKFKKCSSGEKAKFITVLNLSQSSKEIYYLDEPFENIDSSSKLALIEVIQTMFSTNKTLFLSSHQAEIVAQLKHTCIDFDKALKH